MTDETLLSNLSYVNKDFQSIYEELLDYTKKISYKWDPSVSNESDPGVVLIKEMTLCTDKNNYTTDKTGLETFPVSVTQEANARNLFAQLGYNMHWYRAGTTDVSMRWIGDRLIGDNMIQYNIPRFTAVSDEENNVVYTIIDEKSLSSDGAIISFSAIQGTAEEYEINGDNLITVANLDANNRLYFNRRNVAENGIFICNADSETDTGKQDNYSEWHKVDNLYVANNKDDAEDLLRNYFFGVSDDGNSCYIEFPQNVTDIFGEGIYITYILTDGEDGNIIARELSKFFNDVSVEVGDESVKLSTDNVFITNVSSVRNGENPETINNAYRNYKKTIGTFDTLVSLRDYTNAINTSGIVSNSFVCDRTNDIQSSYNVITKTADGVEKKILYVEQNVDDEPLLNAFDLKLYALQKVSRPASATEYDNTFDVLLNQENARSPEIDEALSYIDSKKSVQHDFIPILSDRLVMFKNKYGADCKIIPQYRITALQEQDIANNIRQALYNRFNASQVDFGEEITFSEVYDTILSADVRIKAIALNNIEFNTYAVYYNSTTEKYEEVLINELNSDFTVGYYNSVDGKFYEESTYTTEITTTLGAIYFDLGGSVAYIKTSDGLVEDFATDIMIEIFAKSVLNGTTQLFIKDGTITYDISQNYIAELQDVAELKTEVTKEIGDGTTTSATCTLNKNEAIQLYAPSLIDDTQYSTYIRYEYELNNNIPADSDYKLGNGESIVFFWRDTDDSESDYKYHYYEEGDILHPSFTINSTLSPISDVYTLDVIKNYEAISGGNPSHQGTTANMTITVGSYENASLTSYISQEMSGSRSSLSGTKTITTRKINKVALDSTLNKCYWHLNNKTNGMFELFSANDGSEQSYILKSGEIFLYTNQEETVWNILGEGTKIIRVSNTDPASAMSAWVCEPYSLDDIQEDGASALSGKWQSISSTINVSVQEMQMITLNEGDQFKVTANSGNVDITLTAPTEEHPSTSFADYSLAYYPKDGSDWVDIPNVNLGEDDSWEGNSVLNFVASYDNPQKLIENQSVTAYVFDYETGEIDPTGITFNGDSGANAIYLRPDIPYDMLGGTIDVSRLETSGEITYMTLYAYNQNDNDVSNDETEISFTGPVTGGEVELDSFKVPAGKYILPFQNTRSDISALTVQMKINNGSYETVLPIYGGDGDLSSDGTYYLNLDFSELSDSDEITLKIICTTAATGAITFKMFSLYRYVMPDIISENSSLAIMNKMFELDKENHYDYTYQVDKDIAIDNPLSASSFENINHIFNQYTICQMDNKNVTLDITNKIK